MLLLSRAKHLPKSCAAGLGGPVGLVGRDLGPSPVEEKGRGRHGVEWGLGLLVSRGSLGVGGVRCRTSINKEADLAP